MDFEEGRESAVERGEGWLRFYLSYLFLNFKRAPSGSSLGQEKFKVC